STTATVDACAEVEPVCPGAPPTSSGGGLVPLDRCAFALDRGAAFDDLGPLADGLAAVAAPATLADVAADLNRAPPVIAAGDVPGDPPGTALAFRWEDGENDKVTWIPQGLTSSADADASGLVEGRRWVVASFYYDEDADGAGDPKGVRLAFVDVTDPAAPRYRFVLLVEPTAGPSWAPVRIHAGGIAWVGDLLYVADTFHGFRVFDTTRFYRADTSEDVIGCDGTTCKAGLYAYALPQIGAYERVSQCEEDERFSFVSVDRSGAVPQLVTGEYCSTSSCSGALAGRVVRFPVDPATASLGEARTWSTDAHFMGETQVQGAGAVGDTFYLSSSEPAAGAGALYTVDGTGRTSHGWVDSPEDVAIDLGADQIWSLSEAVSEADGVRRRPRQLRPVATARSGQLVDHPQQVPPSGPASTRRAGPHGSGAHGDPRTDGSSGPAAPSTPRPPGQEAEPLPAAVGAAIRAPDERRRTWARRWHCSRPRRRPRRTPRPRPRAGAPPRPAACPLVAVASATTGTSPRRSNAVTEAPLAASGITTGTPQTCADSGARGRRAPRSPRRPGPEPSPPAARRRGRPPAIGTRHRTAPVARSSATRSSGSSA
ncbi:MAG: hypothetical protein R3F59_36515, partial [Myxococcota bacterium]